MKKAATAKKESTTKSFKPGAKVTILEGGGRGAKGSDATVEGVGDDGTLSVKFKRDGQEILTNVLPDQVKAR
jgi:hypothetical protein